MKLFDIKRDSSIKNSIKFLHLLHIKWKILSGDNVVTTCDSRQPSLSSVTALFLYVLCSIFWNVLWLHSISYRQRFTKHDGRSNKVSQWVTRKQNNINVSCSINKKRMNYEEVSLITLLFFTIQLTCCLYELKKRILLFGVWCVMIAYFTWRKVSILGLLLACKVSVCLFNWFLVTWNTYANTRFVACHENNNFYLCK